jgi:hypothetical protein
MEQLQYDPSLSDVDQLQGIQNEALILGHELLRSGTNNLANIRTGLSCIGKGLVAMRLKIVHTSLVKLPSPEAVESLSPQTGTLPTDKPLKKVATKRVVKKN